MKMNNTKLVAACLVAFGLTANAYATPEKEINNSIGAAQGLSGSSAYSIDAMMGNVGDTVHDDLDYFTFEAKAGDLLDLDIDNGVGGNGDVNTVLGLFDASGNLLRMNAYSSGVDEGSISTADARIDKFLAPADGKYTVAVSTVPRYFAKTGGSIMSFWGTTTNTVGDYTLNISGITATTKQINIEVKPGSNELAPLNPKSQGKIPVAIMGAADFDVSKIKQNTLAFGHAGDENSLSKCQPQLHDLNKDGYADQLCHFENSAAGFQSGDIEAILTGTMKNGTNFEGRALLKVVPSSKK